MAKINHRRRNAILAEINKKVCSGCLAEKDFSDFHRTKNRKHGIQDYCKICRSIRHKSFREENPNWQERREHYYETSRWVALEKQYGVTRDMYEQMDKMQNNLCAICHQPETARESLRGTLKRLCVDHDHVTGKVRGLLCGHCNRALGNFKDDIQVVKNAVAYLELYKG